MISLLNIFYAALIEMLSCLMNEHSLYFSSVLNERFKTDDCKIAVS